MKGINSINTNSCIFTHPDFGSPCTSLILRGPERFLERAVGTIGAALTGVALNTVDGVTRSMLT